MNYARIVDDVAVDVSADPQKSFHPSIAAQFVAVPDEVRPQWRQVGGAWEPPPPSDTQAVVDATPKVSPIEFKLLWTSAERVALSRFRQGSDAESADARDTINDFFGLLEDPRLTFVDLGLNSTRAGVEFVLSVLNTIGVVADVQVRKDAILSGVLQ